LIFSLIRHWIFNGIFIFDRGEAQANSFCFFFARLFAIAIGLLIRTSLEASLDNTMLCFGSLAIIGSMAQSLIDLLDLLFNFLLIAFPRLLLLDFSLIHFYFVAIVHHRPKY
jgi:hypothetical protein